MVSGLEDVVVAETRLSEVDGEAGRLVIAGVSLERFSRLSLEEAAHRLFGSPLDLARGRGEAFQRLSPWLREFSQRGPISALQLGLSLLDETSPPETIVSAFPVILAGTRHGEELLRPDPGLGFVEDFCRLWFGRCPLDFEIDGLSTYLVSVCEHGMNASTFTARVIASTGASRLDAVVGAFRALKGPLHGGAPGPVLDLLDELDDCGDLEKALYDKVTSGERLMGFGHRIYRTRDPRADVLREAVLRMPHSPRLHHAEAIEKAALRALSAAKPDRVLQTNVEFYTAILLDRLGFAREAFTSLFATGRVLGWLAHVEEQRREGRLIRPQSRYVGPTETMV